MLWLKKITIRLICHPLIGWALRKVRRERIRFRGMTIDTREFETGVVARLFWGLYERGELDFIEQFLPRDCDVIELGASLGLSTSVIAKRLAADKKIVCCEANPEVIPLLMRRLRAVDRDVEVKNVAIAAPGTDRVQLCVSQGSLASEVAQHGRSIEVRACDFRQVLAEAGLHDRFSIVADIEGAESHLLFDDPGALDNCAAMIFELHDTVHGGKQLSIEDLRSRIKALGFTELARRGPVVAFARNGRD